MWPFWYRFGAVLVVAVLVCGRFGCHPERTDIYNGRCTNHKNFLRCGVSTPMCHWKCHKAKAKDLKMCPQGPSRPRTCPRGLHHCRLSINQSLLTYWLDLILALLCFSRDPVSPCRPNKAFTNDKAVFIWLITTTSSLSIWFLQYRPRTWV